MDKSLLLDIERIATVMDEHCQRLYDEAIDILKTKGMNDEEIFETNLHLHPNSTNSLSGNIRHMINEELNSCLTHKEETDV